MLCGCTSSRSVAISDQRVSHPNDDSGVYTGEDQSDHRGHLDMSRDSTALLVPGCHGDAVLQCDQAYPGCFAWSKRSHKTNNKPEMYSPATYNLNTPLLPVLDKAPSFPLLEIADCGVYPATPQQARMCQTYRGQLKLAVYVNYGLLTVHIMESRHLWTSCGLESNAYVKVSLEPDDTKRTKCKTVIMKDTNCPVFNEKFSFELIEGDMKKRLLVSVWHKESNHSPSELLGCMSFGVKHVVQKKTIAQGWYYLLSENMGKRKHLHVNIYKNSSGHASDASKPTSNDSANFTFSTDQSQSTTESLRLLMEKGESGFGFTMTGDRPARVLQIKPGSPCDVAGLQQNDVIMGIDEHDVSGLTADTIARVLRQCEHSIKVHIERARKPPDILYGIPQPPKQPVSQAPNSPSHTKIDDKGQHNSYHNSRSGDPDKVRGNVNYIHGNGNDTCLKDSFVNDNAYILRHFDKSKSGQQQQNISETTTLPGCYSNPVVIDDEECVFNGNKPKKNSTQHNYENVFQTIKPPISNLAPKKVIKTNSNEVHTSLGNVNYSGRVHEDNASRNTNIFLRDSAFTSKEVQSRFLRQHSSNSEPEPMQIRKPIESQNQNEKSTVREVINIAEFTQPSNSNLRNGFSQHSNRRVPTIIITEQSETISQAKSYVQPPPYSRALSNQNAETPPPPYTRNPSNQNPGCSSIYTPAFNSENNRSNPVRKETVGSVRNAGHSVPSAVQSNSNTDYSVPKAVYSVPNAVYSVPSTVYSVPNTVYNVCNAVHNAPSAVYNESNAVYSLSNAVHRIPNAVYSTPSQVQRVPIAIKGAPCSVQIEKGSFDNHLTNVSQQSTNTAVNGTEPAPAHAHEPPGFQSQRGQNIARNVINSAQNSTTTEQRYVNNPQTYSNTAQNLHQIQNGVNRTTQHAPNSVRNVPNSEQTATNNIKDCSSAMQNAQFSVRTESHSTEVRSVPNSVQRVLNGVSSVPNEVSSIPNGVQLVTNRQFSLSTTTQSNQQRSPQSVPGVSHTHLQPPFASHFVQNTDLMKVGGVASTRTNITGYINRNNGHNLSTQF